MVLEDVEHLKKCVTDKHFEKKKIESPFDKVKYFITITDYNNSWLTIYMYMV